MELLGVHHSQAAAHSAVRNAVKCWPFLWILFWADKCQWYTVSDKDIRSCLERFSRCDSPWCSSASLLDRKRLLPMFSRLCYQGDKRKAESPAQLIKWVSDNKSIFSHCVDKQYICTVTGLCFEASAMLDSQHYTDYVPIIWLGAAVKTSDNEDMLSKDNV